MVYTLGPSAHLPCLATRAGLGRIICSSDVARFVQGGVVKTFRYPLHVNQSDAKSLLHTTNWHAGIERYLKCPVSIDDSQTDVYPWGFVFVFVPSANADTLPHSERALVAVSHEGRVTPVGTKGVWGALRNLDVAQTDENLTPIAKP